MGSLHGGRTKINNMLDVDDFLIKDWGSTLRALSPAGRRCWSKRQTFYLDKDARNAESLRRPYRAGKSHCCCGKLWSGQKFSVRGNLFLPETCPSTGWVMPERFQVGDHIPRYASPDAGRLTGAGHNYAGGQKCGRQTPARKNTKNVRFRKIRRNCGRHP